MSGKTPATYLWKVPAAGASSIAAMAYVTPPVAGDCAMWDVNGHTVDAGAPCGSSSGGGGPSTPSSTTVGNVPQYANTTGTALSTGLGLVTAVGSPGLDTNVPSEKAVRTALSAVSSGGATGILFEKNGTATASCTASSPASLGSVTIPANTLAVNSRVNIDATVYESATFSTPGYPTFDITFGSGGDSNGGGAYLATGFANMIFRYQYTWFVTGASSQDAFGWTITPAGATNAGYPGQAGGNSGITNNADNIATTAIPITFLLKGCASSAGSVTVYYTVIAYQ